MSAPETGRSASNRVALLRGATLVIVGLIFAGLVYMTLGKPQPKPVGDYGGPFVLQASSGGSISRDSLLGRPYALFFGYTNCPDFCPTTMMDLAQLMKDVGDKAKDFHPYFVTIDPERDTPELLKDYLTAFDPRIVGLTGTPEEIGAVVKSFKIYRKKNGSGESYTFDHTSSVLLFDRTGALAGIISASEPEADQKKKLTRLLDS